MNVVTLPPDPIRPAQAARILACSLETVYRYCRAGRLQSWRRAGKALVLSEREVAALLEPRCPPRQPPPPARAEMGRRYEAAAARMRARGYDV